MKISVECSRVGCTEQIGWEYTSPVTIYGQDPPEVEFYPSTIEDEDGNGYCSERCFNLVHEVEEEGAE